MLGLRPEECRECWERGASLLQAIPQPGFAREAIEPVLGPIIEELAGLGDAEAQAMARFAQAWDEGQIVPSALLPGLPKAQGGALHATLEIPTDLLGFVVYLGLRPAVEAYFAGVRPAFQPGRWDSGLCPFCAAPAAFADIADDGKRWLSCALCSGSWIISRLRCPFCDNRDARTLTRLAAEGGEEGYLVEACDLCRGYLKGVDRRVRWNAAPALIEDWGTPHLDLIATRQGYWRATPSLIHLSPPAS